MDDSQVGISFVGKRFVHEFPHCPTPEQLAAAILRSHSHYERATVTVLADEHGRSHALISCPNESIPPVIVRQSTNGLEVSYDATHIRTRKLDDLAKYGEARSMRPSGQTTSVALCSETGVYHWTFSRPQRLPLSSLREFGQHVIDLSPALLALQEKNALYFAHPFYAGIDYLCSSRSFVGVFKKDKTPVANRQPLILLWDQNPAQGIMRYNTSVVTPEVIATLSGKR